MPIRPKKEEESDEESLASLMDGMNIGGQPKPNPKPPKKMKAKNLVKEWNSYFQKGDLDDFRRLCLDLGLDGNLPSKTQCVKALEKVNVNIVQFLQSVNKPADVMFFKSRQALISYTYEWDAFYPRKAIPKGSPLRKLLRLMIY
ncbi:hypothetical protein G7046_g7925 [Stylonectria norvegica]|nr:hypothetical protein G7046_g7925 [Stylonectria norvegica]